MDNITYQYNEETKTIQKITQPAMPDPIVEDIDPLGYDSSVTVLNEQISGFEQAKTEVQAAADSRKAEMDAKISDANAQIAELQKQKAAVYSSVPNLKQILDTINTAAQQAVKA